MQGNNPFNRQLGIENWNQELIEKQVCLVLGAGIITQIHFATYNNSE
jgi:hypothetical protein